MHRAWYGGGQAEEEEKRIWWDGVGHDRRKLYRSLLFDRHELLSRAAAFCEWLK